MQLFRRHAVLLSSLFFLSPLLLFLPTAHAATPVPALFAPLERLARLVDIAYCVGTANTGIAPPFACASRCRDFPELRLVTTWHTGLLLRDSCGFVAVDAGRRAVYVAFRGTYSVANTVEDLRTVPQAYMPYPGAGNGTDGEGEGDGAGDGDDPLPPCHNCTVHTGFYESWESARPLVLPAVEAALQSLSFSSFSSLRSPSSSSLRSSSSPPLRSDSTVHLVGHSLGGAVAVLAALDMRARRWPNIHVTTFGEPRLGNDGLADFVEAVLDCRENASSSSVRRVTHRNDPVPLLPLAEWGFHAHAGEIYIDKADLPPDPADLLQCHGRADPACSAGPSDSGASADEGPGTNTARQPPNGRLRPWELFFAHRDYFWRLGLCVPADRWPGWPDVPDVDVPDGGWPGDGEL